MADGGGGGAVGGGSMGGSGAPPSAQMPDAPVKVLRFKNIRSFFKKKKAKKPPEVKEGF